MYSKELQQETKNAFLNYDTSNISILDMICMKNYDGRFAIITANEIKLKNYILIDRDMKQTYKYKTLDEMIKDGWVID